MMTILTYIYLCICWTRPRIKVSGEEETLELSVSRPAD